MIDIALVRTIGAFALDAAFQVPADGVTAIWGASGSGKTSLLRAIAGLDRAKGRVAIGSDVWQDGKQFVPVHKRRVGYVFQEPSLLSHLNVAGNLDYAAKRAIGTTDRSAIIDALGIGNLLARSVTKLSGGERQRVALARALMAAPRLLLMDEPLSSLDAAAKDEILPLIKTLSRDHTLPILYVSHDPAEVAALADHVLRLDAGRVHEATVADASLTGLSQAEIEDLALAALRLGLSRQRG